MYASPTYGGYGHNPASNNQPSSFNPNGILPQQQHPHPQLQQQQQQQQQPGQPQQLMYNSQQFAAGSPSPYGASAAGIGMGPNAGAMGMMQNNGMAQMAGPHVSQYQTPYSGSAYGANIPVSAGHLPPNFMPTTNAPSFAMNSTNMNMAPQQMQHMQNMQRMQPPPPSSTPTQPGPRASPFAGSHNNTPPASGTQQSQFSTPQNTVQTQQPTPNGKQAPQATVITPQTPNFPSGVQNGGPGGNSMATPLSPGSEAREKDRVTLLLEINRELLMEVMVLQAAQVEAKKEESSPTVSSPEGSDKEKADKSKAISGREYVECMRRLQANLAYLAAIADRSHKPSSQIPSHPAIMNAPPLVPKPPQATSTANSPSAETKKEDSDEKDPVNIVEDREKRLKTLKSQYKQLQDLFPGVDTKKDSTAQPTNSAAKLHQGQTQKSHPSQGQAVDPNAAQKLQNDQLRQKMMQQAQAQALAQQNQMLGR